MTKKDPATPAGEDAAAMAHAAVIEAARDYETASLNLEAMKAAIADGDLSYGYKELSEADALWRHAKLRYDGLLADEQRLAQASIDLKASAFADQLLAGTQGAQRDGLRAARRDLYESILAAVAEYNRAEREHTKAVMAAVEFADALGAGPKSRLTYGVDDYGNLYVQADEVEFRTHQAISDDLIQRVVSWALFEVREGYRHPNTETALNITA